jgi:hypothetical protein
LYGSASLSADYPTAGAGVSVTITGKAANDVFGSGMGALGDVNADGIDDVLIAARGNDDGGTNAGAAYVVLGSSTLSSNFRIAAESTAVTLLATGTNASDYLGRFNIMGAGDVNQDGFADIMAGAHNDDTAGANAGAVFILYGRLFPSNSTFDTGSSAENVKITGDAVNDYLGFYVTAPGDVNDDGIADILVGSKNNDDGVVDGGAAYIIYGSTSLASSIPAGNADVTILGRTSGDQLGRAIAGMGDINNDGIPDIMVGAPYNDDGTSGNNDGAAYIFFGSESLSSTLRAGINNNLTFVGKAASDYVGVRLLQPRGNAGP